MAAIETPLPGPRRHYILAALILSAIIVVFYLPQAMRGVSLSEGEGVTYYLPMRVAVADAWRHGRLPLWNPYVYGGMPLLADCQAAALYPPNLLYCLLEPLTATNLIAISGHILAAWGMVWLLRAYGVSAWAAGAGAATFVFSGFMVAHMGHVTIVNAAVWLPWLCLATHHWCTRGRRRSLVALTCLWALQFLAGHPQIVLYSAILIAMQAVPLIARGGFRMWRAVSGLMLAAALAMCVCGAQILPTLALSGQTGRTLEPSWELFQNYRFSIQYTPLLFAPYLFGTQADTPLNWSWWGDWNFVEQAGYVGLLPWMVLPAAVCLPEGRVRAGRAWAVIGALNLILAWNIDTPIGRLLFSVPLYRNFEAAGRHLLGVVLGMSMCLGIGLDALAHTSAARRRRWCRRGTSAVVVVLLIVILGGIWGYEYAAVDFNYRLKWMPWRPSLSLRPWIHAWWAFAAPVAFAALSAWALLRFARPVRRIPHAVLLAVLLLDLGAAAYLCAWRWRHEGTYRIVPPAPEFARLLARPDPREPPPRYVLFGPWADHYAINPQGNMLYHFASLNGYGPFQLRRFRDMVGGMHFSGSVDDPTLLDSSRALDLLACRYVVVRRRATDASPPPALADPEHYRLAAVVGDVHVYENLRAMPHAWLVNEVNAAGDEEVLAAIESGRRSDGGPFDPTRTVLVPSDADRALPVPSAAASRSVQPAPGSVRWLAYEADRLRLETNAEADAVVVLAEPFLDGWKAYVDGRPAPVLRANYFLRCVPVPPGTHAIEMRYEPEPVRCGAMISLAGLLGLIALAVWPSSRGTQFPPSSAPDAARSFA